jgi:hypothetical protein
MRRITIGIAVMAALWGGVGKGQDGGELLRVALVLPFSTEQEAMRVRTVEYYEGVLLAVDSARRDGISMELSVFDTGDGNKQTEKLIRDGSLEGIDLLIGGMDGQVRILADFAAQRDMEYVIPFTSHNDDVLAYDNVFEVNTPHSKLYGRIAQATCAEFADDNIIIVRFPDEKEKTDFVHTFRREAALRKMSCREITFRQSTFLHDMQTLTDNGRRNVILPATSSFDGFNKIRTSLRSLLIAGRNISLFGYPDWQTFVQDADDDFYLLDTYLYSSFYANPLSPALQRFYQTYHYYFGHNLINSFPKYGLMGYDTLLFFLLPESGNDPLQTGLRFERTAGSSGGYINTNIFFVRYHNDYSVTRKLIP